MRGLNVSRYALLAVLVLSVAAGCTGSNGDGDGGGDDDDDGLTQTPTPEPTPTVAGDHITTDTTWSGPMTITNNTIVDAGATLTIAAGAAISFAQNNRIIVEGTLVVAGTQPSPVTLTATVPANRWSGISVSSGGAASLAYTTISYSGGGYNANIGSLQNDLLYVTFDSVSSPLTLSASSRVCRGAFTNSGSSTVAGGTVAISDTDFTAGSTGGDTVIFSGSTQLTVSYGHFGTSFHCALHTSAGSAASLTVNNTKFDDIAFALDLSSLGSSGTPAEFHQNDVDLGSFSDNGLTGAGRYVDATSNWWGSASGFANPPPNWDVSSPLGSAPAAGPRAPGTGCETTF